ncbi:MAG: relaxase/mobilization nuclease domain-containing protein [Oligoflexales bacterium]
MAIVKIKFVKHMATLVRYVLDGREQNDPVDTYDCSADHAAQDFESISQLHNGKGGVNAIHLIQSWGGDESKSLTPKEFNVLGRQLVETKFPGHAFLVVTHTETDKVHNHIVVSPWHSESGKKIENKKRHLYELRDINDAICRGRGLSVIDQAGKDRQARLPEKVQKMAQYNGRSWIIDLAQKADFARAYATSFDEYTSILFEFGVTARVEEKNITYYYGSQNRGKRGSKIGQNYDKKGLVEAFRTNDQKFSQIPGLREQVQGIVGASVSKNASAAATKDALSRVPSTTYEQGYKDYNRFTKTQRPGRAQVAAPQVDLTQSIVPIEEIRRARNSSIFAYCRANDIALSKQADGKMVLKGREFVEVGDFEWANTRNRTKGSLIEFVAVHKDITHLQAIAHINGNPRLLILEQHLGETKRSYTSFHIPKERQLRELDAKVSIAKMLTSFGADAHQASTLFRSGQAHVDQSGRIRVFGKDDDAGAFEFVESHDGAWKKHKVGEFKKPFFECNNHNKKMVVYLDPFSFLKDQGRHALWGTKYSHDVLCLMEPDGRIIDQHLAKSRHISEIQLFLGNDNGVGAVELDFFNNLKSRSAKFGIEVKQHHGHEKGRGREADLPSM